MINVEYAKTMATYNRWMNQRLYECCAALADEERKRDVGAFFKSIHGTLNHLLLADCIWLGRFTGEAFAATSLAQEVHADFVALRSAREATDHRILDWVAGLDEARLASTLHYTPLSNPQPRSTPMGLALAHFFNHQTHHRGQITALLSQRGLDPGVTDLLWAPAWQNP